MINSNPLTFCISTYNNLEYLKLAVDSGGGIPIFDEYDTISGLTNK
jgi:hypothetical protein